jgi:deazaflavin-dependent oxidoreductase (nitroreductase family)
MSDLDNPSDPPGWAGDHVQRYVATDGAEGHEWRGVHTLLLTTRGRRSGKGRRTPLIYGRDGNRYVVVASKGGADAHPEWYRNIVADSNVQVQVGPDRFAARARPVSADEKAQLWPVMTGIWPAYDEYQTKTDRDIPVVVLEPV